MSQTKQKRRGTRGKLLITAAFFIVLAGLLGYMYLCANTVHVVNTHVYLKDLPAEFEGFSILYVSDTDMLSSSSAEDTAHLFSRLQALQPDILLLGGDYTHESLFDALNKSGEEGSDPGLLGVRAQFFGKLANFSAPIGKFAVAAADDGDASLLSQQLALGGVQLLYDNCVTLRRGDSSIYLVGIAPGAETSAGITGLSGAVSSADCVVVAAHSPSSLPAIQISEAGGGGQWADLALFGHTHGGQIRIGSRTLLTLNSREKRYLRGWHAENGIKLLVSQGLGSESVRLRLGSQAEVHLITLRCGETPGT